MKQKVKRSFTLIELLVVISIIAILMTILLPALKKAKFTANLAVCKNNQRQQYLGYHNYMDDNDGFWPDTGLSIAGVSNNPGSRMCSTELTQYSFTTSRLEYLDMGMIYGQKYARDPFLYIDPDFVNDSNVMNQTIAISTVSQNYQASDWRFATFPDGNPKKRAFSCYAVSPKRIQDRKGSGKNNLAELMCITGYYQAPFGAHMKKACNVTQHDGSVVTLTGVDKYCKDFYASTGGFVRWNVPAMQADLTWTTRGGYIWIWADKQLQN